VEVFSRTAPVVVVLTVLPVAPNPNPVSVAGVVETPKAVLVDEAVLAIATVLPSVVVVFVPNALPGVFVVSDFEAAGVVVVLVEPKANPLGGGVGASDDAPPLVGVIGLGASTLVLVLPAPKPVNDDVPVVEPGVPKIGNAAEELEPKPEPESERDFFTKGSSPV